MSIVEETRNEIKNKGYWEVVLQPAKHPEKLFSFDELRDVLRLCQVRQRIWHYPHIPKNGRFGKCYNVDGYLESWVRWGVYADVFRFYRSGQFIHYAGMHEDRIEGDPPPSLLWRPNMKNHGQKQPLLGLFGSLFRLTEIFFFASRLARKGIFGNAVTISIKLHNQMDRVLIIDDPMRYDFVDHKKCHSETIDLVNVPMDIEELRLEHDNMAVDCTMKLLSVFNQSSEHLKKSLEHDQKKFYERAI